MSDLVKYEFIKLLDELEEASNIFDEMQEKTKKLKELYKENPNDEKLLAEIKEHEENFRAVYEKFIELNERSKELRARSDAETENQ